MVFKYGTGIDYASDLLLKEGYRAGKSRYVTIKYDLVFKCGTGLNYAANLLLKKGYRARK